MNQQTAPPLTTQPGAAPMMMQTPGPPTFTDKVDPRLGHPGANGASGNGGPLLHGGHDWQTGLCSCLDEGGLSCLTCCCPCLTYNMNEHRLDNPSAVEAPYCGGTLRHEIHFCFVCLKLQANGGSVLNVQRRGRERLICVGPAIIYTVLTYLHLFWVTGCIERGNMRERVSTHGSSRQLDEKVLA